MVPEAGHVEAFANQLQGTLVDRAGGVAHKQLGTEAFAVGHQGNHMIPAGGIRDGLGKNPQGRERGEGKQRESVKWGFHCETGFSIGLSIRSEIIPAQPPGRQGTIVVHPHGNV